MVYKHTLSVSPPSLNSLSLFNNSLRPKAIIHICSQLFLRHVTSIQDVAVGMLTVINMSPMTHMQQSLWCWSHELSKVIVFQIMQKPNDHASMQYMIIKTTACQTITITVFPIMNIPKTNSHNYWKLWFTVMKTDSPFSSSTDPTIKP